jgi:hypothetical protein
MLRTHTANLPPEQRQRIHTDFLANEEAYLRMRASLLAQYQGQWVAVTDGKVIAVGPNLLKVSEIAAAHGRHPYIALVGREERAVFRVRRVEFAYDQVPNARLRQPRSRGLPRSGVGPLLTAGCLGPSAAVPFFSPVHGACRVAV